MQLRERKPAALAITLPFMLWTVAEQHEGQRWPRAVGHSDALTIEPDDVVPALQVRDCKKRSETDDRSQAIEKASQSYLSALRSPGRPTDLRRIDSRVRPCAHKTQTEQWGCVRVQDIIT